MFSIVDGHCDTLVKACDRNKKLLKNDLHIDFERLKKYNSPLQFFAIWLEKKHFNNAFNKTLEYISFFENELDDNSNLVSKVLCFDDILKNKNAGKISALISIEGGEAIEGSLEKLNTLYEKGIRAMTLTWNYRNQIADGSGVEEPVGLTDFGREAINEMERLGMIVDVSHLADKSFWDVCEAAKKPFIATHSNARAICSAKRNLTDEQIKAIADRGGVMGLNMYNTFIVDEGYSTSEDVLRHIRHIINVGGEDVLGLGCDFDGINSMPEGYTGVESLQRLLELISDEFGYKIAEKIAEKNFMRILKETI